jgi:hypothetical protein
MAFALANDASFALGYLPANDAITLNLSGGPPRYSVAWISPVTGAWRDDAGIVSSASTSLTPPDNRDWLLLLHAPGGSAAADVKASVSKHPYRAKSAALSIVFAKDAPVDGLVLKSPADGDWRRADLDGVRCIVNDAPEKNRYLYIDVDDRAAFRGGARGMEVEVQLCSEEPLDCVQLQYDAQGPPVVANTYRAVAPSSRQPLGTWTTLKFSAESPYLGDRQNSGADFRLYFGGRRCTVAGVKVRFEGAESKAP